jgi:hypothetical protein
MKITSKLLLVSSFAMITVLGSCSKNEDVAIETSVDANKVEQNDVKASTIPRDITVWILNDRNVKRKDFNKPKFKSHYSEEGNTATISVKKGDFDLKNSGAKECRVEAHSGIPSFKPSSVWHEFEANYTVNTTEGKTGIGMCITQLKAKKTELPQIMVWYDNGKVSFAPRGEGRKQLATNMNGKTFKLKIRSNGRMQEVYYNGVKKYSGKPFNPRADNYFRWGLYGGGPINRDFEVKVEILSYK